MVNIFEELARLWRYREMMFPPEGASAAEKLAAYRESDRRMADDLERLAAGFRDEARPAQKTGDMGRNRDSEIDFLLFKPTLLNDGTWQKGTISDQLLYWDVPNDAFLLKDPPTTGDKVLHWTAGGPRLNWADAPDAAIKWAWTGANVWSAEDATHPHPYIAANTIAHQYPSISADTLVGWIGMDPFDLSDVEFVVAGFFGTAPFWTATIGGTLYYLAWNGTTTWYISTVKGATGPSNSSKWSFADTVGTELPLGLWTAEGEAESAPTTTALLGAAVDILLPRTTPGDPNVRGKTCLQYKADADGKVPCLGSYMDDKIGTIKMWSGTTATIPGGWLLCNGQAKPAPLTGNTPDLSGRFIVGISDLSGEGDNELGPYALGATGGFKKHNKGGTTPAGGQALVEFNGHDQHALQSVSGVLPQHTHGFSISFPSHSHTIADDLVGVELAYSHADVAPASSPDPVVSVLTDVNFGVWNVGTGVYDERQYLTHGHGGNTGSGGNSTVNGLGTDNNAANTNLSLSIDRPSEHSETDNRPPFYALAFIVRVH